MLKKSDFVRFSVAAYSNSGHLLSAAAQCLSGFALFFGFAVIRSRDQAIFGVGGEMATRAISRLRFCTVAASRNSLRAPVRLRSRSLVRPRMCLASPKSVSIFLRSALAIR